MHHRYRILCCAALAAALCIAPSARAHDPEFTSDFDRDRCTFSTTGSNPYFPLWPGLSLTLQGEEEDDEEELIEIEVILTVTHDTERVNGIMTRVVEEHESEDGELVEISRNFMAICRETGDVWYFGEDVTDFEDGEPMPRDDAWRDGEDGATAGLIMPGSPLNGARFHQEMAPGVAEDQAEIQGLDDVVTPAGLFEDALITLDFNPLDDPGGEGEEKAYGYNVGLIVDEEIELVEITPPPCQPDETTHCLQNGRFAIEAEWERADGSSGDATAILPTDIAGEFWFFRPTNTELIVKVLDACDTPFNSFWVFSAGLTNVGVTLTVTDTATDQTKVYTNEVGDEYHPMFDIAAFQTCP